MGSERKWLLAVPRRVRGKEGERERRATTMMRDEKMWPPEPPHAKAMRTMEAREASTGERKRGGE